MSPAPLSITPCPAVYHPQVFRQKEPHFVTLLEAPPPPCNHRQPRLQPYVTEAATIGSRGCNPMRPKLQLYVIEAASP